MCCNGAHTTFCSAAQPDYSAGTCHTTATLYSFFLGVFDSPALALSRSNAQIFSVSLRTPAKRLTQLIEILSSKLKKLIHQMSAELLSLPDEVDGAQQRWFQRPGL